MAGETNKKKERDPIFMVCLVLFAVAAIAVLGVYIADHLGSHDDSVAKYDDKVTVDYIGAYNNFYGNEGAVVFDTSYSKIAKDESIAKSNEFTVRSSYSPLEYTVGGTDVLKVFGDAVIGHKVGDKIQVKVPASEAYVGSDTQKTSSLKGFTVPETQVMPTGAFASLYGLTSSTVLNKEITTVYGWKAIASYSNDKNTVVINNLPEVGKTYTYSPKGVAPASEDAKLTFAVTSVADGKITTDLAFKNTVPLSGTAIQMMGFDFGSEKWYVKAVGTDTFTYKTSPENVNEDLYFDIEIVSIA